MNKLLEKISNSIDYKTYKKIENSLLLSAFGTSISGSVLNFTGISVGMYLNFLSYLLYIIYFYCNDSSMKDNTRDVCEIRKLYQEFISNYNKLNKLFNFYEPISIYTMFNYLVYEGYLSRNKKFESLNNNYLSFGSIRGVDVINGIGVCRHISSMFTDILNDYGINACNVCCFLIKDRLEFSYCDKKDYSREKNIIIINKYAASNEEKNNLINLMDFCYVKGIYIQLNLICVKNKNLTERIYGNHLITYSLYNDKSYYLDPTQKRILRLSGDEKDLLYDDEGRMKVKLASTYRFNNKYRNDNLDILYKKMLIPNSYVSNEESNNIITSTMDICKSNRDIFEDFYNEYNGLYDEISYKLVRIRRK